MARRIHLRAASHEADHYHAQAATVPSEKLVAIVVPCKGLDPSLPELLAALAGQQRHQYRVFFTVASPDDAALPMLRAWIDQQPGRGECVVFAPPAGLDGKIGNMVGGLQAALAADASFVVFLDSDTIPDPLFIAHLLAPLHEDSVTLSTGARVLVPADNSLAQWIASLWLQCSLPGVIQPQFGSAWGGAMALRADDARRLDLATIWRDAFSDDHTLSAVIRRRGGHIAFARGCLLANPVFGDWGETLDFMMRQLLVLRLHDRRLWLLSWLFLYPLLLPIVSLGQWLEGDGMLALGTLMALLPLAAALVVLNEIGARQLRSDQVRLLRQPLRIQLIAPLLLMVAHPLAMVRTALLRRFLWRGRHYQVQAAGIVPLD